MSMPEFIRVKDLATKHEYSIVASTFDEKAHKLLDKPATHTDGTALPPKHYLDLSEQGGDSGDSGYASLKKAELQAEVEKRNEDRDEDDLVVVEGKGTVADLVAALTADDAKQADPEPDPESLSSSTIDGESAIDADGQLATSDKEAD